MSLRGRLLTAIDEGTLAGVAAEWKNPDEGRVRWSVSPVVIGDDGRAGLRN